MRSTLTTSTLESKFPVMAVEHGCIVSKRRRHHGGFPGDTAGSVFGIIRGI